MVIDDQFCIQFDGQSLDLVDGHRYARSYVDVDNWR
jgi:hypothetical protein